MPCDDPSFNNLTALLNLATIQTKGISIANVIEKLDMWFWAAAFCLICYCICSVWFLCTTIIQLHLLSKAIDKATTLHDPPVSLGGLPVVTVQVPVYNERYVIRRLLTSLSQLKYPKHLYEIQVLDDSTDDTSLIIDNAANILLLQGINITIIRRNDRVGYKAGALQAGLKHCRGELIAIFDADFIPQPDFLERMVGYFNDGAVGGVQGRWTHQNLHENSLTIIQTFLLDSHFNLEQQGRVAAGYFLNFNGTAGVWRKQCILDAGGWNGQVLTEDLELSYRSQLKGWKFLYDNEITVPAELPANINAFKSQQFRWAKGMAQTASIHLRSVIKLHLPPAKKLHAVFHLLGSLSFLAIMGNILLTGPVLAARQYFPQLRQLSTVLLYSGITLPVLCAYYYFGTITTLPRKTFWKYLPLFLTVYLALSVQNSIAVVQGLAGHISPFVRTPKTSKSLHNIYSEVRWSVINWWELSTAIYMLIVIGFSIYWSDYFLLLFLIMTLTGLMILVIPAIDLRFKFSGKSNFHKLYKKSVTAERPMP